MESLVHVRLSTCSRYNREFSRERRVSFHPNKDNSTKNKIKYIYIFYFIFCRVIFVWMKRNSSLSWKFSVVPWTCAQTDMDQAFHKSRQAAWSSGCWVSIIPCINTMIGVQSLCYQGSKFNKALRKFKWSETVNCKSCSYWGNLALVTIFRMIFVIFVILFRVVIPVFQKRWKN